ncbi:MAG: hypothetical protein LN413_08000, partial [Candidatus Thermoplasmatota archaeon]|nr:hypothetical protein [Candidatus Thermoplasmatota archaeon]
MIVAAPLVAFVIILLTGRWQWQGGAIWTIGAVGLSFVFALGLLIEALLNGAVGGNFPAQEVIWYRWLGTPSSGFVIEFGILIDSLSVVILALV